VLPPLHNFTPGTECVQLTEYHYSGQAAYLLKASAFQCSLFSVYSVWLWLY